MPLILLFNNPPALVRKELPKTSVKVDLDCFEFMAINTIK
jgi:hypothetical protein